MLKTAICRLNSINSRILARRAARNVASFNNTYENKNNNSNDRSNVFVCASLPAFLAFFQKKDEDGNSEPSFLDKILPDEIGLLIKKKPVEDLSTPEAMLKNILKRTILCIRKGEFDKAEQMAHLALRSAQDIQSYDGITLCYDIMANLAFDREQYQKAEKLFENVLQRLLQKGVAQDDIQVLHLSLKMAQLVELQNKKDEAKTNYTWTIKKLEEKRQKEQTEQKEEDTDLKELWGLASHFYGKFLLKHGKFAEAAERLKIARDVFVQVRGRYDPDYVNILNDVAVACLHLNDFDAALQNIDEAILLASPYTELIDSGVYHANKALILLKTGLLSEAKVLCKHANDAANRSNNPDGKEQAKYCLEQIEKAMKKAK